MVRVRKSGRKHRNRRWRREFADDEAAAAGFWQRRFYDFNVWSAKKVREKLEYMHANPVKRGLVRGAVGRITQRKNRDRYGSIPLENEEARHRGSQVARKVKNRTLKTEGCGTQKSSL